MKKSAFTPEGEILRRTLRDMLKTAGLTQRSLAARLGTRRSLVSRVLQGERRIDFVEFVWWCRACKVSASATATRLVRAFEQAGRAKR